MSKLPKNLCWVLRLIFLVRPVFTILNVRFKFWSSNKNRMMKYSKSLTQETPLIMLCSIFKFKSMFPIQNIYRSQKPKVKDCWEPWGNRSSDFGWFSVLHSYFLLAWVRKFLIVTFISRNCSSFELLWSILIKSGRRSVDCWETWGNRSSDFG